MINNYNDNNNDNDNYNDNNDNDNDKEVFFLAVHNQRFTPLYFKGNMFICNLLGSTLFMN